jgi:hypothetical protein
MIDCCERSYEKERLQGLKNVGKNHQKVVLTELSETGTEKPIHQWSVCRRVNVGELRSKLSYNLNIVMMELMTLVAIGSPQYR